MSSKYFKPFIAITAILTYLTCQFCFPDYKGNIYTTVIVVVVIIIVGKAAKKIHIQLALAGIDNLSGKEFEKYIIERLEDSGYRCKATSDSNDYGADIIAIRGLRSKIVVQTKRYSGKVGIKAVQEVAGAMNYYKATKGAVVASSCFTKQAQKLAERSGITLVDRKKLKQNKIKL